MDKRSGLCIDIVIFFWYDQTFPDNIQTVFLDFSFSFVPELLDYNPRMHDCPNSR